MDTDYRLLFSQFQEYALAIRVMLPKTNIIVSSANIVIIHKYIHPVTDHKYQIKYYCNGADDWSIYVYCGESYKTVEYADYSQQMKFDVQVMTEDTLFGYVEALEACKEFVKGNIKHKKRVLF